METKAATALSAAFSRFGVGLGAGDLAAVAHCEAGEAILLLLADREIAARFDAAHGRPPDEADIEALLDVCEAMLRG